MKHYPLTFSVIFVLLSGCATFAPRQASEDVPPAPAASVPSSQFIIGPADILSISVLNQKDLDQTVRVRPDGRFSFSLIGEVQAAGLTPQQLQEAMHTALSKYVNVLPDEVSVRVDSIHSYTVSVLGEVRTPGRFEFLEQVSVLEALAQAGGLTEFASPSDIVILRSQQGKTERIHFDYKASIRGNGLDPKLPLIPGDVVIVPETT